MNDAVVKVKDYKVCNDFILVKLKTISDKTDKGIIKSDKMIAEEKAKTAELFHEVIQVGPDCKSQVKVGNLVTFIGGHVPFKFEGVDYGQVREHSLLGYLE